ncbi:MAG: aminodeoxychorismate synthase component I [Thiohalophilus sp.]|jgi:anthranilate synthase component 1
MTASSACCFPLPEPVSLLALHRYNPRRYPYLLQSAVNDQLRPVPARYDILFAFPGDNYSLWPDNAITCNGEAFTQGDFLQLLDEVWEQAFIDVSNSVDLPFTGGWFVYLGYELAQQIESRLELVHDRSQPVASLVRIPAAVIHDHATNRSMIVAEPGSQALVEQVREELERLTENELEPDPVPVKVSMTADDPAHYCRGVEKVHQYIVDGDVFQVNLSRGWQGTSQTAINPADVYQQLCNSNPAPFAGLACLDGFSIISSSPERLIRIRDGIIETRPIAGTRPRGNVGEGDDAKKRELIGHPKERAEHIMLIDLERNDLGRVCKPGTVRVDELMVLESYAHVHHIVSNVRGELRDEITPGKAIRAVFPGGTITGCPKERCMAIIAELEQVPRGAYTGSMGYLNHNGELDLNILIRTITLQDNQVNLRAGAGLVFDSVAKNELRETEHKARGMLLALGAES